MSKLNTLEIGDMIDILLFGNDYIRNALITGVDRNTVEILFQDGSSGLHSIEYLDFKKVYQMEVIL